MFAESYTENVRYYKIMEFRSKFAKYYRIPNRVYIKTKSADDKINFKEILEVAAKCVPLFIVAAYCVGFFIFALYFINDIGIAGKINFFTHLEAIDHLVIFGIGAVLLLSVFTSFISPSLMIYESLKENKACGSTEQSLWKLYIDIIKTGYKKSQFRIALLICFSLGTPFLLLIISFYPKVLLIFPSIFPLKYGVYLIILMGWIVLFLINLYLALNYQRNKNILWGLPLVMFLFLIILSPQSIINLAGYGNSWACLTLTPSEGQSLKLNPKIENLLLQSCDGYWYTPQSVFIILQLRDYVFIAKDDKKIEAIEVISKKEAHIFHVTPAPVSKRCDSSKEKTT